ncbi:hypothetical protein [Dyella sp.]|uniref:hypothetical protein n=1 Tax=Dyella sp. TaxID=1869338 RepID=UPI002D779FE7|nr:hypothetical protein [Dyella sp.]HET7329341.1 hypothetical protein [Dyella sp.]
MSALACGANDGVPHAEKYFAETACQIGRHSLIFATPLTHLSRTATPQQKDSSQRVLTEA